MKQTAVLPEMELALQKPDYSAGMKWGEIWSREHKQQRIQIFKVFVKGKACQTIMKAKGIAEKSNDFAALSSLQMTWANTYFLASKDEPFIDSHVSRRNVTTSW